MSANSNSWLRYAVAPRAVALATAAVALYAAGAPERVAATATRARDNFTSIAARHGYAAEEHVVATQDGYLLTLFRIRRGVRCAGDTYRTPVYLMTGLLLSAESWLDAGPGAGLAFLLPDACFDTWVGTSRGSTHARRHRRLDPRAADFWQFSADEIGSYDVPAAVDYILAGTGAQRLNYVGFSQGGAVALVMLAERPQYASKLGVLVAIAPPVAPAFATSPFISLLVVSARLEAALAAAGVYEVFATGSALQRLGERLCGLRAFRDRLCKGLFEALDAPHPGSVADGTFETMFSHAPAGTSVRTMAGYGQMITSGSFRKYDFGERGNLRRYGSARPPEYALGAVATPTVLLQGARDALVTLRDTRRLARRLPALRELYVVDDPAWNHLDAVYSRYINKTFFPKINQYLLEYN